VLDAQGRQYLDIVRAEAQRMGQLIDDLLQLSRVTRGELVRAPVDLSALAQSVARRLTDASPDRAIEFLIQPGLVADVDARLLEVALTNLLDNACKFSGKRDRARIEFGHGATPDPATRAATQAYFVRDNGVGFDTAHAAKLFGAFQRLHAASEFPGSGIGLATVQRIVHRHGGRIWAEAQPDRCACFYFTLGEAT
jgi:signal transduction histidine kinase